MSFELANGLYRRAGGSTGAGGQALDFNFTETGERIGPCNYAAVRDPTSGDDSTVGFSKGSRWINNSTLAIFDCVSAAPGSAIWNPTHATPIDPDLIAIGALTGLGYLRRTGLNTWSLGDIIPPSEGGTGTNDLGSNGNILINRTGHVAGSTTAYIDDSIASLIIDGIPATNRSIRFRSNNSDRWSFTTDNTPESDPQSGSNFLINRYANDGSYLDTPLQINRDSGHALINNDVYLNNNNRLFVGDSDPGGTRLSVQSNQAGTPVAIASNALAAAGTLLLLAITNPITGNAFASQATASVSGDYVHKIHNTGNGRAIFDMTADGDGDSLIRLKTQFQTWTAGVDRSQNDQFVISASPFLGVNNFLTIDYSNSQTVFNSVDTSFQGTASVNQSNARDRYFQIQTDNSRRWSFGSPISAEPGANVGSDFVINRYDDSNFLIDSPFTITRSNANITLKSDLVSIGSGSIPSTGLLRVGGSITGSGAVASNNPNSLSLGAVQAINDSGYVTQIVQYGTSNGGTLAGMSTNNLGLLYSQSTAGLLIETEFGVPVWIATGNVKRAQFDATGLDVTGAGTFTGTGSFGDRLTVTKTDASQVFLQGASGQGASLLGYGAYGAAFLVGNGYYDGVNWQRFNTSYPLWFSRADPGSDSFVVVRAAAGANPASPAALLTIDNTGVITASGYNGGSINGTTGTLTSAASSGSILVVNSTGGAAPLALQFNGTTMFSVDAQGTATALGRNGAFSPFVVNAPSGQSANLTNWQVNSSTVASVSATGGFSGTSGSFSNGVNSNSGASVSTTALNPGLWAYSVSNFNYGVDLGYNATSARYRTRLSAPTGGDVALSYVNGGSTTQSAFTDALVVRGDSGRIGVYTLNPSAIFEINSVNPGNVALALKAVASQTGNLLEVNSNSGSGGDLAKISSAGNLAAQAISGTTLTASSYVSTTGVNAAYYFGDRTSSRAWGWYGSGDTTRLYNGSTDILTVTPAGVLTTDTGIFTNKLAVGTTSTALGTITAVATNPAVSLNSAAGKQSNLIFYDNGNQLWLLGANYNNAGDQNMYVYRVSGSGNFLISPNGNGRTLIGTATDDGVNRLQVNGGISSGAITGTSFSGTTAAFSGAISGAGYSGGPISGTTLTGTGLATATQFQSSSIGNNVSILGSNAASQYSAGVTIGWDGTTTYPAGIRRRNDGAPGLDFFAGSQGAGTSKGPFRFYTGGISTSGTSQDSTIKMTLDESGNLSPAGYVTLTGPTGYLFYKDSTPSAAWGISPAPIGGSVTNDAIFSYWNGSAWAEKMRFTSSGGLTLTGGLAATTGVFSGGISGTMGAYSDRLTVTKTDSSQLFLNRASGQGASLLGYGAFGDLYATSNGYFDATNWQRNNTSYPLWVMGLESDNDRLVIYRSAAGANPATLTALWNVNAAGDTTMRNLVASGTASFAGDTTMRNLVASGTASFAGGTTTVDGGGSVYAPTFVVQGSGQGFYVRKDATPTKAMMLASAPLSGGGTWGAATDDLVLSAYSSSAWTEKFRFYNIGDFYAAGVLKAGIGPTTITTAAGLLRLGALETGTDGYVLTMVSGVPVWAPSTGGSGTVTSVGLSLPSELTVTVSPITSTGNLTATWANASGNKVIASPVDGSSGAYVGRALGAADIPALDISKITTGNWGPMRGGTGLTTYVLGDLLYASAVNTLSALAGNTSATKKFLAQTGTGSVSAAPVWSALAASDVGLGNVENIALSTWTGSANITTLGTIGTGTWAGTTIAISHGGTGQTSAANAINALLPTQTGNTGKYLTTNGSVASWASVTASIGPNVIVDDSAHAKTYSSSSGTDSTIYLTPNFSQGGSAGSVDLWIDRNESSLGGGSHYFAYFEANGSRKFHVTNNGVCDAANGFSVGTTPGYTGTIPLNATNISVSGGIITGYTP